MSTHLSYRDAGVDIEAGDQLVDMIKPYAKRTMRPEVLSSIGGFGALVELSKKYHEPVLVSGTDGVGTKLKLAFELQRHDTIGIDLVAMSVNDILVHGAEPLFFLDYFACGQLKVAEAATVIKGIAAGCEQAGCALIGGETAEMPGMYAAGEYDLAGFAVGVVEKADLITGEAVTAGDVVLGLASNGAHSNGYSLIRKLLALTHLDLATEYEAGQSWADILLAPTRIYVKPILALLRQMPVKGIAHITGGGLRENIPRILPPTVVAELDSDWPLPKLFKWLQQTGNIDQVEMHRTFNCGIGMVIVVAAALAEQAMQFLTKEGETVYRLGHIRVRQGNEHQTRIGGL